MKLILGLTAALLLAGCASVPVTLNTPEGEVTCQNYTDQLVLWDQAIAYPKSMPKAEADRYCRELGVQTLYNYENKTRK